MNISDKTQSDAESTATTRFQDLINDVDRDSIISIALSTRRDTLPHNSQVRCTLGSEVAKGTYNAVWFIDFEDGVQWVFRTPLESDWSPIYQRRFQSDIWTMQLIQSRTSVPTPRIVTFSTTRDNPIGRPYIILERAKGVPLHKLWFDPSWFSDEKRKTVMKSLASSMSQLEALEFPQIGSIAFEDGNYFVGPLLPSYNHIMNDETGLRGPYNSVHSFLMDALDHSRSGPGVKAGLRVLAGSIPDERLDGPPFVLSMPDYDVQNVYVDNEGNVTALLDWDDVFVGPRQAGYAKFPLWMVCDINHDFNCFDFEGALEHNEPFPAREEVKQDWPEFLPKYRAEYLDALKEVNPANVALSRHSHLVDPLIREVFHIFHFGSIEYRLFRHMFIDDDGTFYGLLASFVFEGGLKRVSMIAVCVSDDLSYDPNLFKNRVELSSFVQAASLLGVYLDSNFTRLSIDNMSTEDNFDSRSLR